MTGSGLLNEIKKAVLQIDHSADVILFGSWARGDFKDESDWDILILTSKHLSLAFEKRNEGSYL
ncbi:MAG: hypothetical protein C4308_04290 [Chitinophagaceae bacterium]